MDIISKFFIRLSGKKIGQDEFGNEYFQNKANKRFVVYRGIAEPSKVPAEWHGWLHYTTDIAPVNIDTHKFSWQKIHLPNLTGTLGAHSPKNFNKPGFKNQAQNNRQAYESWQPKN